MGKEYDMFFDKEGNKWTVTLRFIRKRTIAVVTENCEDAIDESWMFEYVSGKAYPKFSTGSMIDDDGNAVEIVEACAFYIINVGGLSESEASLKLGEMIHAYTSPVQLEKIEMPKHEVADRPRNRNWHFTFRHKRRK